MKEISDSMKKRLVEFKIIEFTDEKYSSFSNCIIN